MKIIATFAGFSYTLKLSQLRLIEQAKKYFDGSAEFDENSAQIIQLFREHPSIAQYRRGAGFWLWKPYIILTVLDQLKDGDFVFYMDSGTDIIDDISPLFKICEESDGILLFENRSGNPYGEIWNNETWTKKDCFVLMGCDSPEYHKASQVDGAYVLIQKNKRSMHLVRQYFEYCTDRRIITDEPNTLGQNYPQFLDHRHDQSVLSLLAHKYKIPLHIQPSEVGNSIRSCTHPYGQLFQHHRGTIFGRR